LTLLSGTATLLKATLPWGSSISAAAAQSGAHVMELLDHKILEEVRQLSPTLIGTALVLGLLLWLLGGWGHRFWLVMVITLLGGMLGLSYGADYGMQPLVAGLLLAVSAGALALALVRIFLFAAGGLAGLALVKLLAPAWDEPLACFLAGGLLGIFLYRLWVTTLASLVGTLLTAYSALCLLDRWGKLDSVAWAQANAPLLNWACAALTVVGVLVQFLLERRRRRRAQPEVVFVEMPLEEPRPRARVPAKPLPWWARMAQRIYRKAG
jgi:hypothetical protein